MGDALAAQQFCELAAAVDICRSDDHRRPGTERLNHFEDGGVETCGRESQNSRMCTDAEFGATPCGEIDQRIVRDGNTFRCTSGTGRVDQIGDVIASQRRRAVGVVDDGLVADKAEGIDRDAVQIDGQHLMDSRISNSHNSITVPDHVIDSFDRVRRIDRN